MTRKKFERLPTDVVPINYALTIKPDLEKLIFTGEVIISVKVARTTKNILLNGLNLSIESAKYSSDAQAFESGVHISYSEEDETVALTFPEEIKEGEGTLSLTYSGVLNDKLKGFYRSRYTSPSGDSCYAGVTHFEPTGARQAFPCWDEPAVKATFDVSLVVPKNRVAISNMPVKQESEQATDPNLKVLSFERSPVMSTYLVAFVVGEYDYVEDRDADGILVRVYTPLGKKDQGLFALNVAKKTLPFYKDYFKVPYSLPKMDLIAIADFGGGAMENWGLLTYRETALLIDEQDSSVFSKQRVALVVGHEIAHQWFGDLVTPDWWSDLWLKEGFASWIEYLCVDHCFPEFDIWTNFASTDFSVALNLDALRNSHPIEVVVGHPSEIEEIFDTISYSKGASVIRMLHDYIGDEDFRKGMNIYLTRHMYKNACTEDLWNALAEVSSKPVGEIMSGWTMQMGYPMIKVGQKVDGTSRTLTLEQERFLADGTRDESGYIWMVPITVCSSSNPTSAVHKFVLDKKKDVVTLNNIEPNDWIKLNVGGIGFYRTVYPADMLDRMLPSIKTKTLSPRDRLALQNDLFALARGGLTKISDVLKAVESFENETNFTVWSDLDSNLSGLSVLYQNTDCHDKFKSFVKKLFSPAMKSVGWDASEGEGPLVAMLRNLLIGRMGRCGDEQVVEEAKKRFRNHRDGKEKLPGDLRSAVYAIVLQHGNEADLEDMLKLYRSTDLQEEKVRILRSLGSVSSPELVTRVLEFSLSSEVRSQDSIFTIVGATGSLKGRELVWNFIKDNWEVISERYSGSLFLFPRLIKLATENFACEDYVRDVQEFFEKNPAPSAERSIKQSLESIKLNIEQLNRDLPEIQQFLEAY